MRRTSVSLPTKHVAQDPHEKPDRYDDHRDHNQAGLFSQVQAVFMSQTRNARWLKTVAIVFTVVLVFYWVSPRGVHVYRDGKDSSSSVDWPFSTNL